MNILMVASEGVPFAKTGGLGDVIGSLPGALSAAGHEVRVVLPFYGRAPRMDGIEATGLQVEVELGPERLVAGFRRGHLPGSGVPVDFVENQRLYGRDGIYGDPQAFHDNDRRFIFLCKAALLGAQTRGEKPDVVHGHDWQAAAAPILVRSGFAREFFADTATVFTIHNLAYQGNFSSAILPLLGLSSDWFSVEGLEFYGRASLMKGAIVCSDVISTVSPSYSDEILTAEYGFGLEGVLATRRKDLFGILNGIDPTVWDPEKDPCLAANFSSSNLRGKKECRGALEKEAGLTPSDDPLLGFVGRLTAQKGLDLLFSGTEALIERGFRLVVLGTGEPVYEEALRELSHRYPGKFGAFVGFDEELSRRVFAGSDFCLMPSRFEPCGLNQLIALRYGTLPIVTPVGGLRDTVVEADGPNRRAGIGNGFVLQDNSLPSLVDACERAGALFRDRPAFRAVRASGMEEDHSWARSADEYGKLYERARQKRLAAG